MARKNVTSGHVVETEPEVNGTALDAMQEADSGVYAPDMAPLAAPENAENPEGTALETPKASPKAPQTTPEDTKPDAPDKNTPEGSESTEDNQGLFVLVALKKGATYRLGKACFKKNEATSVSPEMAKRLLSTGFFESATVSIEGV